MTDFADAIATFYARGLERDRLAAGAGALEFARTQLILQRHLPPPPALIADVGGGPGRYASWLAGLGYQVRLVDPVPLHIEQARAAGIVADQGDARDLPFESATADAVLLLGPLYHLPERTDRLRALTEARRVCRPGGVIVAAAISRFASMLDGMRGGYLEDPAFAALAAGDLRDGRHENPTGDPTYFTTAYFHRPEELAAECVEAGLVHQATLGVEGPAWLLPDLDARLQNPSRRAPLLDALSLLEAEPALLGVSAHLVAIAWKESVMPSPADPDVSAATRATIDRFNEAFNRHDVDAIMALMTPDCVFDNTRPAPDGDRLRGQAAVRAFWVAMFERSPQARFEAEEIVALGDRCVVRWVYHWVRDGQPGHVRGIDLFRVEDGRVAEKLSYVKG